MTQASNIIDRSHIVTYLDICMLWQHMSHNWRDSAWGDYIIIIRGFHEPQAQYTQVYFKNHLAINNCLNNGSSNGYSRQQNHSDIWEFWIVHWIYILIKWLEFWKYSDIYYPISAIKKIKNLENQLGTSWDTIISYPRYHSNSFVADN